MTIYLTHFDPETKEPTAPSVPIGEGITIEDAAASVPGEITAQYAAMIIKDGCLCFSRVVFRY